MKKTPLFFFSLHFILFSNLNAQTVKSEIQLLKTGNCNDNIRAMNVVGNEVSNNGYEIESGYFNDASKFKNSIKAINSKYQNQVRNDDITRGIMYANNEIVKNAIAVIPDGGFGIGIFKRYSNMALEKVYDDLKKSQDRSRKVFLGKTLAEIKSNNVAEYQELIDSGDSELAVERIKNTEVYQEIRESLSYDDREILTAHILDEFKEAWGASQLENIMQQHKNTKGILQNAQQIARVEKTFVEYAEKTNKKINALHKNQVVINEKLHDLNNRVDRNENDIQFLKDYTYGKMSPTEKLQFLKRGMSNLKGPTLEKEKEKQALLEEQEKFMSNANYFLSEASALVSIANNLNVDSDLVVGLGQAVAIGSACQDAATAYMSGNYLQALSSVTGLMGEGKPDPEVQRFEIMQKMLSTVLENQEKMKKSLNELKVGQKKIM